MGMSREGGRNFFFLYHFVLVVTRIISTVKVLESIESVRSRRIENESAVRTCFAIHESNSAFIVTISKLLARRELSTEF